MAAARAIVVARGVVPGLCRDALGRAGRVQLKVWGESMGGAIRSGDRLVVESLGGLAPAPGEIVLAVRGERVVAHRVVACRGMRVITRGDALARSDPPWEEGSVLGRVVRVVHRRVSWGRALAWLGLRGTTEER